MTQSSDPSATYQSVGDDIHCIETDLYRPGLAACYLMRSGDRLAFIDTGPANCVPRLLSVIEDIGLTPEHVEVIIPTHVHLDHAGGVGTLLAACPNARVWAHPRSAPHLIDPSKLTAGATAVYGEADFNVHFGALVPVPEARLTIAEDGDVWELAGRRLTSIDTPGHANHHHCIHDAQSGGLFTGDTFGISYRDFDTDAGPWLFAPTTPVAFDPEAWHQSLDRLMALEPTAAFLTHYCRVDNPPALVGQLRQSIDALAEIALACEQDAELLPSEGRKHRIQELVTDQLLTSARRHGCDLPEGRMRELLKVDLDLNAQGLEVWLQRRARRASR